jgi:hypothetical protein
VSLQTPEQLLPTVDRIVAIAQSFGASALFLKADRLVNVPANGEMAKKYLSQNRGVVVVEVYGHDITQDLILEVIGAAILAV